MAKNIPVGRIGDVKDISSIVSFLASDESSYITGQVLHVNGGLTL
jgi:3-oxoacyl-[acyl-carrier protein] reductase